MKYLILILLLAGCGSTTDRQTKIVETEKFTIPALTVTLPVGNVVLPAITIFRQREQVEVEKTEKVVNAPEIGQVVSAVANSGPWGGIIAAIGGLGAAAAMGKKALDGANLSKKLVKAQSDYANDLECAETDADVAAVKVKHVAKQQALGIHDALAKARHG